MNKYKDQFKSLIKIDLTIYNLLPKNKTDNSKQLLNKNTACTFYSEESMLEFISNINKLIDIHCGHAGHKLDNGSNNDCNDCNDWDEDDNAWHTK